VVISAVILAAMAFRSAQPAITSPVTESVPH
jgi:hypothetical protein